jgi:hypothetical protein
MPTIIAAPFPTAPETGIVDEAALLFGKFVEAKTLVMIVDGLAGTAVTLVMDEGAMYVLVLVVVVVEEEVVRLEAVVVQLAVVVVFRAGM